MTKNEETIRGKFSCCVIMITWTNMKHVVKPRQKGSSEINKSISMKTGRLDLWSKEINLENNRK